MKFWLGMAQINQGGLQLCCTQLALAGNECRGIIVSGEQQFTVEGRGGHQTGAITTGYSALSRKIKRIEGMGRARPAGYKNQGSDQQLWMKTHEARLLKTGHKASVTSGIEPVPKHGDTWGVSRVKAFA